MSHKFLAGAGLLVLAGWGVSGLAVAGSDIKQVDLTLRILVDGPPPCSVKGSAVEFGEDEEELFELAMHDRQYRDYKSGVAKKRFMDDLQRAQDAAMVKSGFDEETIRKYKRAKADPIIAPDKGQILWEVSVEGPSMAPFVGRKYQHDEVFCYISTPWGEYEKIFANFTGRIVEVCAQQGAVVNKGDVIAYLERTEFTA